MMNLQVALAIAYAAGSVSLLRIRSWKSRHGVTLRVLDPREMEGVRDLVDGDDSNDDEYENDSEIDSLLSPFSRDFTFGIQVDGEIIGIDTVRVDAKHTGYVEDVKIARGYRGLGLERELRRFSLNNVGTISHGKIGLVRHLAFEWSSRKVQLAMNTGMHEMKRWGYQVMSPQDLLNHMNKAFGKIMAHVNMTQGIRPCNSLASMKTALNRFCTDGLLLQYWDVYDYNENMLKWLCAGLLTHSPKHGNNNSNNDPAMVVEDDNVDDEAFSPLPIRNCTMQVGDKLCSLGEFIDRDEPSLGSLCTFTIYCDDAEFDENPDMAIFEAICHINYWCNVAARVQCQSVAFFVPSFIHNDFVLSKFCKQKCQLILFEKRVDNKQE